MARRKQHKWRGRARRAGTALAAAYLRRQLRVVRAQLAAGAVALSALAVGVRWAWRRHQAAQPAPAG